jgi:Cu/Ag efflux protein CusF
MKPILPLLVLLAAAPASFACDDHNHSSAIPLASAKLSAPIEATVREVDAESRRVALAHGPIPSLRMQRMESMVIKVDPAISLDRLKPGDKVSFRVKVVGGVTSVGEIVPR